MTISIEPVLYDLVRLCAIVYLIERAAALYLWYLKRKQK